MHTSEFLDIWNLTHLGKARCGAVEIFNVTGRLHNPQLIASLAYSLNRGPETPVYFNTSDRPDGRLCSRGDFNIDTINCCDLKSENSLLFVVSFNNGAMRKEAIQFYTEPFSAEPLEFSLTLDHAAFVEEVGQVVEGPWVIAVDENNEKCLEVTPENAGYDRIITFGSQHWSTGYEIKARVSVTSIHAAHNFGLVFKWNPHAQGDGTFLPRNWSSGLAYYCSYTGEPGIRLRFGVDVHKDASGKKLGDYLLANTPLNRNQLRISKLLQRARLGGYPSELKVGEQYWYRLKVHPEEYALTVWRCSKPEPAPQVRVAAPQDRLPTGAVGILAYEVSTRIYEYEVKALAVPGAN